MAKFPLSLIKIIDPQIQVSSVNSKEGKTHAECSQTCCKWLKISNRKLQNSQSGKETFWQLDKEQKN